MKRISLKNSLALCFMLLLTIAAGSTVLAGGGSPYDRLDSYADPVVFRESEPAAGSAQSAADKLAWQKINGVCYNGSGKKIPGAITRGIDVSSWQESINWSQVKTSNVDFAMIRISHGLSYMDPYYEANMRGAENAGIPAGCYVYTAARNVSEAIEEAQMAIRKMNGFTVSYPVAYDIEDETLASTLTKAQLTDLVIAFCTEIRNAGYYPIVYCNPNWCQNHLDMSRLTGFDAWLAWYSDTLLCPDKTVYSYTIWQATCGDGDKLRSTEGMIKGISGSVDLDFGFVDYTKKITPRTSHAASYVPTVIRRDGWVTLEGKTYYYKNNVPIKGLRKIGGKTYSFSQSDGHLNKNVLLYSGSTKKTMYIDGNGCPVKNRWVTYNNRKYYFGKDCYAYTGSRNVGGKFYFFDKNRGYMHCNYKLVMKNYVVYYYGADGVRVRNRFQQIKEGGKTHTYYFASNYQAYKGWHKIRGKLYYFYGGRNRYTGSRAENTTLVLSGMECVFDKNGVCTKRTPVLQ